MGSAKAVDYPAMKESAVRSFRKNGIPVPQVLLGRACVMPKGFAAIPI